MLIKVEIVLHDTHTTKGGEPTRSVLKKIQRGGGGGEEEGKKKEERRRGRRKQSGRERR